MDTSYLAQQVTTIIGQLHGLFDEIGVPNHERETREAEVGPVHNGTQHCPSSG
jgi:Ase1/PRC1/MAP65 family protein